MEFQTKNLRTNSSQPIDGSGSMEATLQDLMRALFEMEDSERERAMVEIAQRQVYCSKCGYGFVFGEGLVADTPQDVIAKVKCGSCGADAFAKTA